MAKQGKILIVDDNVDLLKAAKLYLKRHFAQVDVEKDPERIPDLLNNEQYDVILLDMNFTKDVDSGQEGFYWMDRILQIDPSAVIVLITAYGNVDTAVRAIKEGATNFVLKPWENEKLLATIMAAMRLRSSKLEVEHLRSKQQQMDEDLSLRFKDIIGNSPAMLQVFETIERVAATDANVLILGENGTGKELIARAIHRNSSRKEEACITVDLGAISETLFESELFGHEKGAFTDARASRAGRFEIASGGTLFLDEIGNLSLPLQAKLLTALQSRTITRIGSNQTRSIDIRLISATNMDVYEMVSDQSFRQDLLYRINTIELKLPPLRDRIEDIPLLTEYFLKLYAKKYHKEVRKISPSAIKRMEKYHWPGNVRELQHAVERAVIMNVGTTLQADDFYFNNRPQANEEDSLVMESLNIEDMEKVMIRKALKKYNGNITQAADELGLTRSSLYRRLEKYGI
ncbi:sigma-54-dependent transcriptional regulator [Xanthovirga aplysinae]|uniref:sigma-54-dependent transcriptional regulator n=1 Tax=Xanthovirga aplysinae TaxID=2529853 RepID=UPI0012BC4FD7|nr:sigma-54 dependent transcriptional regulator [Xanthovirga aplysinae]MTI30341.1 sigma-54-dependent Fis family transcriptional regulator [Xanthovirga aplysinae]